MLRSSKIGFKYSFYQKITFKTFILATKTIKARGNPISLYNPGKRGKKRRNCP
jgi:hypothetical protein